MSPVIDNSDNSDNSDDRDVSSGSSPVRTACSREERSVLHSPAQHVGGHRGGDQVTLDFVALLLLKEAHLRVLFNTLGIVAATIAASSPLTAMCRTKL